MRLENSREKQYYSILMPAAEKATSQLKKQTEESGIAISFSDEAWEDAKGIIYTALVGAASPTLEKLMNDELSKRTALPSLAPQSYREAAAAKLLNDLKMTDLLERTSPLLPTLLGRQVSLWHSYITEVFTHISEHKEEIRHELLCGRSMGKITGLCGDGADVHNGGRFALHIKTVGGLFLYKPHSCRADVMYEKLTEKYFSDITRAAHSLDFGDYGFCEYIEPRSAVGREAAGKYFHNLGGLCALFQALGSTDLHYENILVQESLPVLVDVETVLTPSVERFGNEMLFSDADFLKNDRFADSINNSLYPSGLLPYQLRNMQFSILLSEAKGRGLPECGGRVCTVRGFEDEFFGGFKEIYHRCMMIKTELSDILDEFCDAPMRRLVRNTSYYGVIRNAMLSPDALQSEQTRKSAAEKLKDYFIKYNAEQLMPIAEKEIESMLGGDIPYFYCVGGEHKLYSEGKIVFSGYIETSGVENAKIRLQRLSEDELKFELALLKQSLAATPTAIKNDKDSTDNQPERENAQPVTGEEALAEAERLFDEIAEAALPVPDGGVMWLEQINELSPQVLNSGYAKGVGGIGLFFAMIAKLSESRRESAKMLLHDCLEYDKILCQRLDGCRSLTTEQFGPGLADGAAGELYRLSLLSELGYEEVTDTINSIHKSLHKLSLDNVPMDIYSGLAGLVLVMCRCPKVMDKALLSRFTECILSAKTFREDNFPDLWQTAGSRVISGFGHGMAGIGAALAAAWEIIGDDRLLCAAEDAFLFEHKIYSGQKGAWPDRRPGSGGRIMHGYCSGAPGIGLALVGCMGQKDKLPYYDEDLNRATAACLNHELLSRDGICCGNGSAAEFLLSAGEVLSRPELKEAAARILGRIKRHGYRYFKPEYTPAFRPSLFHGAAGVGAVMLRFAGPDIKSPLLR